LVSTKDAVFAPVDEEPEMLLPHRRPGATEGLAVVMNSDQSLQYAMNSDQALQYARQRVAQSHETVFVWYVAGPDQWGRSGVFYARTKCEGQPEGAILAAREDPPSEKKG